MDKPAVTAAQRAPSGSMKIMDGPICSNRAVSSAQYSPICVDGVMGYTGGIAGLTFAKNDNGIAIHCCQSASYLNRLVSLFSNIDCFTFPTSWIAPPIRKT